MSVSVCAGWKYCSITISPLACSFWLVLNVCCGKASAGEAEKCKPKSALSCGSAMRVLVFSWASTVAPAACRLALLSVWSKCQCVSITVFSGALPSPSSVSFNFGQAGIRNVSTTILPSGPFNTTTFPPGPESTVRLSASGCDWIGALPICARIAARWSVEAVAACCRGSGTPALRRLAGNSWASRVLPANAAELRNISRHVLCLSKTFGVIFVSPFECDLPLVVFRCSAGYSSWVSVVPLTGKWRYMSEKGQSRKSMFSAPNMVELRRLYDSDTPVLAYTFKRRTVEGWTPEHSHHRGQLVALTQGLLIVETGNERWMFPSQRCAWTPPDCKHAARSVGGAAGSMVDLSPEMCRGLPKTPCMFNSSELLFAIVHRMVGWDLRQPLNTAKKHLITTLRDEIRQPDQQPLRLTIPREERLARVVDALLDDVGDDRTLDAWAHVAGMARRTFMRAFSSQAGMSFGRWRQQARLFAALEMLAQRKSVTEVAIAVGYDSVSAFIEMFRTMLGTTPQTYFRGRQELGHQ